MKKIKILVLLLFLVACRNDFKSTYREDIRLREIDGVLVYKPKLKYYLNKSTMKLNPIQSINVSLNWDYSGNKRETGTYDGEQDYETDKYNLFFNLYVNVELENDDGDYWNPPTFDVLDEVIEITELKVYNLLDEEIKLSEKETLELINKLENLVNYD